MKILYKNRKVEFEMEFKWINESSIVKQGDRWGKVLIENNVLAIK